MAGSLPVVANHLERVLHERDLSRLDLAALAGLSYPVVRRLVRGRINPTLTTAVRIASVLDLPVEQVFSVEQPH